MDLTKEVTYRGFPLNHITKDGNQNLSGCEITRVDWPGVQGEGYDEKRAMEDGYDASDVYLSKRLIGLSGNMYGVTRGQFFDLIQAFSTAMTPTAAYDDSPGDKGFLPMDFYVPTMDLTNWSAGYIHRMVLVRPVRQPSLTYFSDRHGGDDDKALAVPWTALVEAKDPRVYFFTTTDTAISGTASSGSGNLVNKGDYPAPLNVLLVVAAGSVAGTWRFVGAGTDMTITIPANVAQQVIRYSSREKILTVEVGAVTAIRMDLLAFAGSLSHPMVPVGSTAFSWTLTTADLATGGRIWHWDSWA